MDDAYIQGESKKQSPKALNN